jgi:nuclear RNA export factor
VYEPIIHLSLANNHLSSLRQLDRLPNILSHVSALDLSDNPIASIHELTYLLANSEKKGRATAGVGSLKSLRELKLTGCKFREDMLAKPDGVEHYKQ